MVFPAIIPSLDPAMSRDPTEGYVGGQSGSEKGGEKYDLYLFGSALDAAKLQLRQVVALRPREHGCNIIGIHDESYSAV